MKQILTTIILLTLVTCAFSQDPNFHIYLCFGQSNMEGQGAIGEKDQTVDSRFKVLQALDCANFDAEKGVWRDAVPPLFHCYSGLSPADYFGRTMALNLPDSIRIGVICVAIGGCDIRIFDKDIHEKYHKTYNEKWFTDKVKSYNYNPYQHMIELAKQAQKNGVIKGILLHQGETNTGDEMWPQYVKKVYGDILTDLSLNPELTPILAGEVVGEEQNGKCARMNPIIRTLPDVIPTAHVISSKNCEIKEDNVHFNAAVYRELGKRYEWKMISIMNE